MLLDKKNIELAGSSDFLSYDTTLSNHTAQTAIEFAKQSENLPDSTKIIACLKDPQFKPFWERLVCSEENLETNYRTTLSPHIFIMKTHTEPFINRHALDMLAGDLCYIIQKYAALFIKYWQEACTAYANDDQRKYTENIQLACQVLTEAHSSFPNVYEKPSEDKLLQHSKNEDWDTYDLYHSMSTVQESFLHKGARFGDYKCLESLFITLNNEATAQPLDNKLECYKKALEYAKYAKKIHGSLANLMLVVSFYRLGETHLSIARRLQQSHHTAPQIQTNLRVDNSDSAYLTSPSTIHAIIHCVISIHLAGHKVQQHYQPLQLLYACFLSSLLHEKMERTQKQPQLTATFHLVGTKVEQHQKEAIANFQQITPLLIELQSKEDELSDARHNAGRGKVGYEGLETFPPSCEKTILELLEHYIQRIPAITGTNRSTTPVEQAPTLH